MELLAPVAGSDYQPKITSHHNGHKQSSPLCPALFVSLHFILFALCS